MNVPTLYRFECGCIIKATVSSNYRDNTGNTVESISLCNEHFRAEALKWTERISATLKLLTGATE